MPQLVHGYQSEKVTAKEKELTFDAKELQVRAIYQQRSDALVEKLKNPAASLAENKHLTT